jgi:hypothetical protein
MPPLIWRYCKMFFTESAARGLIDVIDVIDHAWRPRPDTPATCDGCCAWRARAARPTRAARQPHTCAASAGPAVAHRLRHDALCVIPLPHLRHPAVLALQEQSRAFVFMGDLKAWLDAVDVTCQAALLGPLDEDYGVREVSDLPDLEVVDIDKLEALLKRSPGKKFRRAVQATTAELSGAGSALEEGTPEMSVVLSMVRAQLDEKERELSRVQAQLVEKQRELERAISLGKQLMDQNAKLLEEPQSLKEQLEQKQVQLVQTELKLGQLQDELEETQCVAEEKARGLQEQLEQKDSQSARDATQLAQKDAQLKKLQGTLQQRGSTTVDIPTKAANPTPQSQPPPQPQPEPQPCDTPALKRTKSKVKPACGHWSEVEILNVTTDLVGEDIEVHDGDEGVWVRTGKRWPKTDRYPATLVSVQPSDGTVCLTYPHDPSTQVKNRVETTTITLLITGQRLRYEQGEGGGEAPVFVGGALLDSTVAKGKNTKLGAPVYVQTGERAKLASEVCPRDEGFGGKHDGRREEVGLNTRKY